VSEGYTNKYYSFNTTVWKALRKIKACVVSIYLAGKAATDFEFIVFWSIMLLKSL